MKKGKLTRVRDWVLFKFSEAFVKTFQLLTGIPIAVKVFGCSTTICESTFTTLTAIDRPQRLPMANLVYFDDRKDC